MQQKRGTLLRGMYVYCKNILHFMEESTYYQDENEKQHQEEEN